MVRMAWRGREIQNISSQLTMKVPSHDSPEPFVGVTWHAFIAPTLNITLGNNFTVYQERFGIGILTFLYYCTEHIYDRLEIEKENKDNLALHGRAYNCYKCSAFTFSGPQRFS